jgi:hypothetical protein
MAANGGSVLTVPPEVVTSDDAAGALDTFDGDVGICGYNLPRVGERTAEHEQHR